ncbi:MAG TPA: NAD(P)-dependent oxidoreductase, partial [Acidisoma sp.]|uniref:NAD(P)-dependent oxidoreductase n=1 Tax=Acidisoma sp. TaxID=1872115 RepID=UPI002D007B02
MRVLVSSPDIAAEGVAILEAAGLDIHTMEAFPSPQRLAEEAARLQVDAIIARQGRIDGLVMDASPRLRIIARHGAGTDEVDLDAARARNLLVTRTPGANAVAVAEHTLALVLALFKDIPALGKRVAEGGWRTGQMRVRDLAGARIGLYGMGPIGQETARLAHLLGMRVSAFSRRTAPEVYRHATRAPSLDALLAESEVLSLHTALTPETHHVIGARALATLPAGAFLVNTARGGLIDEAALIAALDSGHIAGAGL